MSFSHNIFAGLLSGIFVGVLLGELVAPIKVAADGFVKLLQMTVLPYVTVSLISSLGRLNYADAKRLGLRAGAALIALWVIALTAAFSFPFAFPVIESAAFFSTTLTQQRPAFNFIDLYIPANPFYSLANNIVPAVVLFSIVVGVALIGVEEKQVVLNVLVVTSKTIARATRLVVRLTPYGLFAIAAHAAGTLHLEQIERIQIYQVSYICISLLAALWILPGFVSALTPIHTREVLEAARDGLITAFMASDLFIVLPILIDGSKQLLERHHLAEANAERLPEVLVPASFNFPHAGKLLSLSFILFAGWFSDAALPVGEYPRLAITGVLTFFGSLNVAIPFLLDHFRIPADTFQLFLATGVLNSHFGALLAAVHTVVVGLIGSAAVAGAIRFNAFRLLRYAAITALSLTLTIVALRLAFNTILKPEYAGAEIVANLRDLYPHGKSVIVERETSRDASRPQGSVLDGIRASGVLRAGFMKNRLPFAFQNRNGELVGFDVEMAHLLAQDLGVQTEFVAMDSAVLADALAEGECDILMTGMAVTPERAEKMLFSASYLDETLAFIVLDHLREEFSSWERIRSLGAVRVGIPNVPYYINIIRQRMPDAKLDLIPPEELTSLDGRMELEVIAFPAERGSILTLLNPRYTVVVPTPDVVKIPLGYPISRRDQSWASVVDTWIELKRKDGTIDALYRHWILGQDAVKREARWSFVRNVLHWVD